MLRGIGIISVLFLTLATTNADEWPGKSDGDLLFYADHAAFKGADGHTLVEFYVLLEAAQIQYVPEDGKFVGEMFLSVTMLDTTGTTTTENSWTRRLSVDDLAKLGDGGALYRDVTGVQVPPGAYVAVLSVEDMFGDRAGEIRLPVEIPDYRDGRLAASDVVLASSVERTREASKFSKSGYDVVPNTTRTHLLGQPLNAYWELYHLAPGENAKSQTFVLGYSLTDTNGVAVRSFPTTRVKKPGSSAVKTLVVDTAGLSPGRYYFQVEAFDSGSRQHIKKRRSVRLASDQAAPEEELTEDQLRQFSYYKSIKPLATKEDLKVYDQLKGDDPALMKFLRQFWKKLDPTPGTAINERLIEHIRRMRHSDDYFSGRAGQAGSDTEMGRVYIQYGAPDDIERVSGEAKPYEIWHYGRHEFVFLDRNALGNFELVHSDYPGELNNPMWREVGF